MQNTGFTSHPRFSLHPLGRAISLAAALAVGVPAVALAPSKPDASTIASQAQQFNIPAGSLSLVLSQFAGAAGVALSFDAAQFAGQQSSGLQGRYTLEQGFAAILSGSGYQAVAQGNGDFVLAPVPKAEAGKLKAVTVSAAGLDGTTEGSNSYTSPAVTIGKEALSLREIPQSVSVVTRQRMDDQNLTLIETALDQVTGIQLDTTTGIGSANLYARGFLVNAYQYDGVPQTFLGTSYTGFDLAVMDRVEVIRGAAGLMQGTGNPSAAVNLVRKKPTHDFAVAGSLSAGSWDAYRGEFDVGGPLNDSGTVRGRFITAQEDAQSFVDYVGSEKSVYYGVLEADLTPATTATFGLYQQRVNATPSVFGLPRYADGRSIGLDRSTVLTPSWNWWSQDIEEAFANITHSFDGGWELRANALYSTQLQDFARSVTRGTASNNGVIPGGAAANIYTGVRWNSDSDRSNLDINASGPLTLFGRQHELLIGANSIASELTSKQTAFFPPFAITDIFSFDPTSVPEPAVTPYISGSLADISQHGIYTSGRFSIADPLKLILGARMSWSDTRTDANNLVTGVTTKGREVSYDGESTPYAGVIYDLNRTYSLYASYADIFTPQTTQFSPSGDVLDPLVGANYEAGVKAEFLNARVNASLALFRIDQQNRAIEDLSNRCSTASTAGWCYVSEGEVRSEGVEIEVSGQVTDDLNVFAGYTYNENEFVRDNLNAGMPFRTQTPRHMFKLWTQYQIPYAGRRWSIGGGVNAQSSYYAMSGTVRSEQGSYAIAKMNLAYQLNSNINLALNVNNLFDETYYSGIRGVDIGNVYGDPRNATLVLRAKF